MDINYKLYKLKEIPWLINDIADIYLTKWGWYYDEEYNINTLDKMIKFIYDEYMDMIYVLVTDSFELIGSVMLSNDTDLSKIGNCKLLSYLYINDQFIDYKKEYSNILIDKLSDKEEIYSWCSSEKDMYIYNELGFSKYYQYTHNGCEIIILRKLEFVNR